MTNRQPTVGHSVASGLLDRLRRHYIKPSASLAGGVFVPEVGLNDGRAKQRRCDAVYVGFTTTSGRLMVGHEIKISRADWRHELDQPDKAEVWASQCHAWYIVAPSTAVVPVDEVPDAWGLMVPDPRSKVRMKIIRRAPVKADDHEPSWLVARSLLARLDTLQAGERSTFRREEAERARQQLAEQVHMAHGRQDPRLEKDRQLIDQLSEQLGVDLRAGEWHDSGASPEQVRAVLALIKDLNHLVAFREFAQRGQQIRVLADRFDHLQRLAEAVLAVPDHQPLSREQAAS